MIMRIPWNNNYTMEWLIFKFVPKIVYYIDEAGKVWKEKNDSARFGVVISRFKRSHSKELRK